MFSLAEHAFTNWLLWRSDGNREATLTCIAGVLIMIGAKGFELLL
jgi:hypothetical protein